MDTNDTQTWITGGLKTYRNNSYSTKNSPVENSLDYSAQFNDVPTQSKSRAALILTEVEEQLQQDESKYNSMKDRFNYMKNLYMSSGTNPSEITDLKPADDVPLHEIVSPRDTALNSLLDDEKGSDDNATFEETQCYGFYNENALSDDIRRDETAPGEQSSQYSARSYNISPRQIYLGVQNENSSDSSPQNYFSDEASEEKGDEKKVDFFEEPSEDAAVDHDNQIHREDGCSDISNSRQHPYQLHLAEYSKNIHEDSRDAGNLTLQQDQEIYTNNISGSARSHEEKKPELFLNLSGSVKSEQVTKYKKSRSEKHRKRSVMSTNKKNFSKQVDDTFCGVNKIKRKKRRLKASNSRSTTATRDTCFPAENKKNLKKRKQQGHATMPTSQFSQERQQITAKIQQTWGEVVEIYHNRALETGSLSMVSSKHSRLETRGRSAVSTNTYDQQSEIKDPHSFAGSNDNSTNNIIETELQRALKSQKNSPRIDREEDDTQTKIYYDTLQDAADLRSGEPNRTKLIYKAESSTMPNANQSHEEFNDCHHHHHKNHRCPESPIRSSAYYDPMVTRNYELPTVASKMKRVNRSYYNRFNFRNIPFVVGTSVTPSYNLGLNIQETMSLIKTRQRMRAGVAPLFISKVSKGVRPVSTLLGCAGDQDEIPVEESGTHFDEQRLNYVPNAHPCFDTQLSCAKTTEIPPTKKRQTQSISSSMKLYSYKSPESNLQLTPSALLRQRQEELNIGDSQSTNMNGIREVLVNFHDQFEAMNMKYEKLQEQAEKSNDESLKKEMAALEEDLSAKEEEINAVVNLYKEVMALKQQMKLLHQKNSLVCVATESPGSPMYPQISSRAETTNPMLNYYRPSHSSNSRGPSSSTRLAGLLRQIKIFQKQLK